MGRKERENQIDFIQKVKEFMYFSPTHFDVQEAPQLFEFERKQAGTKQVKHSEQLGYTEQPFEEFADEDIHEIGRIPTFEDLIESERVSERGREKEENIERNRFNADKFEELMQKVEKLERALREKRDEIDQSGGIRKTKVKNQIISLLKQRGKLSSYELSKLIGLSRTRCNEYFRELTREGLTEGVIIDRKKFYKLMRV